MAGLHEIAEPVPGPSTEALGRIAKRLGVAIGAGLLEVVRGISPRRFESCFFFSFILKCHSLTCINMPVQNTLTPNHTRHTLSNAFPIASSISKPMFYNTYVVVDWRGNVVASQRKMNPFVSPHLSPGDAYNVFSLAGFKFGILICYGRFH